MPANLATLSLRSERPEDGPFLREVYGSTRQEELEASGLPVEMRPAFLDLQFKAQQQGYRSMYPQAQFHVILLGNQPVGRMAVNRAAGELRLIDIALLPQHRNQGIGTALIQKLSTEAAAAGQPLRLSVVKGQRAVHLYHRLGFAKTGESGWRDLMEWRAGKSLSPDQQSQSSGPGRVG
ncbi:MAG TPA: GNAT family N-acetyltransferase [Candidatus Acidoferrum sp.]|nr:GNAT family N-acetyltransferase [Candidatus Acidoferrum sp.]